jgi:hypothetical protein
MKRIFAVCNLVIFLSFFLSGCQTRQPTDTPIPSQTATATEPTPTIVPTKGRTIIVTSTAASGPGTLRQALLDAGSGDTITFDPTVFPPEAPVTIFLMNEDADSALPNITFGNLTIDASDVGVIIDGSYTQGDWVNGLEIYSDRNVILGLQIVNFSGSGIALCSGSHNMIGGERGLGKGLLGQGNLFSMNGIGIDLCDKGSNNTVMGNIVGTDTTDTYDWGNTKYGIWIENGMTHNTIGPDNIIAHNGGNGIQITGSNAFGNTITKNSIYDNYAFGIFLLNGGNTMLFPPQISDHNVALGTVSGTSCANCIIEIFSDGNREGKIYEGQTIADSKGSFTFSKGGSFTGPNLNATNTDAAGNTSDFSSTYQTLQDKNRLPKIRLQPRKSQELSENYIGRHWHGLTLAPDLWWMFDEALEMGLKRFRLSINSIDSDKIDWELSESAIEPIYDDFISGLADNDVTITYVLSFWDKAYKAEGGEIPIPRFKTEEEILRYLEFVQFIVRHFKDHVQYYEIWNEPNISHLGLQWIEVEDYINLVKRTVPIIRQEDPTAKIIVGGTPLLGPGDRNYLFSILRSDIMPLVDAVSWHAFQGQSPSYNDARQHYYEYPNIVQSIKNTAYSHGFEGEFIADEIAWRTENNPDPDFPWTYSETVTAKYYLRGILINLGMGVRVSQHAIDPPDAVVWSAVQNLCTIMAGVEPLGLPLEITSEATNIVFYAFAVPNGDRYVALWTDGVAVDNDPGVPATLTFPNSSVEKVTGIDVLHGFEQELITSIENGNLVIRDLLLQDYPLILRLSN